MKYLASIIGNDQVLTLFLSIAAGHLLGKIQFRSLKLGSSCGTLLAGIVISSFGGNSDHEIGILFFALFLYAVGYESAANFVNSLSRNIIKDIALAVILAFSGLICALICVKIFNFDLGTIIGISAGALTQSTIIGTSNDLLAQLTLAPSALKSIQQNMAEGFAVSYLFGVIGSVIFCSVVIETLFKRKLRVDALIKEQENKVHENIVHYDSTHVACKSLVSLVCKLPTLSGESLGNIRREFVESFIICKVKRDATLLSISDDLKLDADDIVLVFCKIDFLLANPEWFIEQATDEELTANVSSKNILFTNRKFTGKSLAELFTMLRKNGNLNHSVWVLHIKRNDKSLLLSDAILQFGDVIKVYGAESDLDLFATQVGITINKNQKTNFVALGAGFILAGLLSTIKFTIFGITLKLGVVGCLIAGLLLGWINYQKPNTTYIPLPVLEFLKGFGLDVFMAVLGLSAGKCALEALLGNGVEVIVASLIITIVPLYISYLVGRYVLGYKNCAVLAGALAGARSSNPAFGVILEKCENSVPTLSFTITYTLSNLLLTIVGPLLIVLLHR